MPTPQVAGSGALSEPTEYALGYIWAEFGAFRLICARYPYLHRLQVRQRGTYLPFVAKVAFIYHYEFMTTTQFLAGLPPLPHHGTKAECAQFGGHLCEGA